MYTNAVLIISNDILIFYNQLVGLKKNFNTIKKIMNRSDIGEMVIATDAGREGELVARWIMKLAVMPQVNSPSSK